MEKPAQVMLKFNRVTESHLLALLNDMEADDRVFQEVADTVLGAISVDGYSLEDHQFIRLKLKVRKGKAQVVVHIPRSHVLLIMQGKGGPDPFRIAGGTTK